MNDRIAPFPGYKPGSGPRTLDGEQLAILVQRLVNEWGLAVQSSYEKAIPHIQRGQIITTAIQQHVGRCLSEGLH